MIGSILPAWVCPDTVEGSFGICANICAQDRQCKGNQHCCRNECGGRVCVDPEKNQ
jgi:hypothetical protein